MSERKSLNDSRPRPDVEWQRENITREDGTITYCPKCRLIKFLLAPYCDCGMGSLGVFLPTSERTPLVVTAPREGAVVLYADEDRPDSYHAYWEPDDA